MLVCVTRSVLSTFVFAASAYAGELDGCWKSEEIVFSYADGKTRVDKSGSCLLKYDSGRLSIPCRSATNSAIIDYAYEIVRPGTYVATIVSNTFRPDAVGATREYNYRIEGEYLYLMSEPQKTTPDPVSPWVKVESFSVRISCPPAK